jgi:hypothetical protein
MKEKSREEEENGRDEGKKLDEMEDGEPVFQVGVAFCLGGNPEMLR